MHDTDRRIRVELVCVLLFCAMAIAAQATTITVTSTDDSGPGLLRQALADANDGDVINFDPSLNGQAIRLTTPALVIDDSISITGPVLTSSPFAGATMIASARSTLSERKARVHTHRRGLAWASSTSCQVMCVTIAGLTISYGHDTGGGIFQRSILCHC